MHEAGKTDYDTKLLAVGTDKVFILLCLEQYDRKDGDNCGNQKARREDIGIRSMTDEATLQINKINAL